MLRFQREAEAAARLQHAGICTVFDAGLEQGVPFLAMQYVVGQTLATRIKDAREHSTAPPSCGPHRRDDLIRAVHIVERVARAAHAAHEAGVVHRDLKPGNIMVSSKGDPVILDFGLARDEAGSVGTLTLSSEMLGTPAYMAPEQIDARLGRADRRTDVYGLAATLYECVTHRPPSTPPPATVFTAPYSTGSPRTRGHSIRP